MSTAAHSIREIVTAHPSAAAIFRRFEIDVDSLAEKSLESACVELQISVEQVLEKLSAATQQSGAPLDPSALSPAQLIQHIVRTYHHGIRCDLPGLAALARELSASASEGTGIFSVAAEKLEKLRAQLSDHIQREEQVLFPFIAQMDQEMVASYPPAHACFRSVTYPVFMMEQEHESANLKILEILDLLAICDSSRAGGIELLSKLREFAQGFRQHVHLENDILFPRALAMENQLNTRG